VPSFKSVLELGTAPLQEPSTCVMMVPLHYRCRHYYRLSHFCFLSLDSCSLFLFLVFVGISFFTEVLCWSYCTCLTPSCLAICSRLLLSSLQAALTCCESAASIIWSSVMWSFTTNLLLLIFSCHQSFRKRNQHCLRYLSVIMCLDVL
jgi:hypothetical protein